MADHYVVLTRPGCVWCERVFNMIEENGDTYSFYDVTADFVFRDFLKDNGVATVPQVFCDGEWIGGHDDLKAWMADDNTDH